MIALVDEEIHRLFEGHLAGVHLDAHDVARVAQQRVLQLAQAQLQIFLVAAPFAVAFQHHLLGVVRPALGIGVRSPPACALWRADSAPTELHVVAGIRFVDGH